MCALARVPEHRETERRTDRQTDRRTDEQTNRQTHRHTDRHTFLTVKSRKTQCMAKKLIKLVDQSRVNGAEK